MTLTAHLGYIQATLDDFEATPRRARCELWHWLNGAPEHRGAMRVLVGSHRPMLEYWDRVRISV